MSTALREERPASGVQRPGEVTPKCPAGAWGTVAGHVEASVGTSVLPAVQWWDGGRWELVPEVETAPPSTGWVYRTLEYDPLTCS